MKKILLVLFSFFIAILSEAKTWPNNALSILKGDQSIQTECGFLSAMLGRDMSDEYAERLLQAYKFSFSDYSNFEAYVVKYRYKADPIRVDIIKDYVKKCKFSNVWDIIESNVPEVYSLRIKSPSTYSKLKKITTTKLKEKFGSVSSFAESLCLSPNDTIDIMKQITAEAASEVNCSL